MVVKKGIDFEVIETERIPVILKFRRKDGSILKIKATKCIKKPKKVSFKRRR